MNKKILILKNDRAGDLFTSITLISSLLSKYKNVTIYLSELNIGFDFFFNKVKINKINFDLSISNKFFIFLDILMNNYSKIYILTPKSFYFFLPFIFRNIKFYAIVYDGKYKNRPYKFLRKYLYKYKIIYRDQINLKSYRQLQCELIDDNIELDFKHSNLYMPKISTELKNILPKDFLLFQFRYLFFEKMGWGIKEFEILINQLSTKYKFILFSSDIEINDISIKYNKYFSENYSIIDTSNYSKITNKDNPNFIYLKDINSKNLYFILNESSINLAQHGLFSHISFFLNKKSHSLFNFKINNKDDLTHEKTSFSEWYRGMSLTFSFLDNDIKKACKKILKNI